ncbi:MAG TPA: YetF domain-containing protein [Aurantimonas sp.]|uniref:DUF421 domain-containing protein n=1 Tax=Aurantimonas marianensis TaxID=2920428 RepID=A0A9X2H4K6_9HYPH|nr:YetF domain-containing protein [Aurantimonas marianensis]MCP3053660.1 DUF421 domain-containing protein [Aurantimonas marianensis]
MFFDSWQDLLRIVVVGVLAYAGLILLLRTTGKRTLSKMNAFDLVVTVALGSILATVLLSKETALSEGLLAFVVLCGLQYVVAWVSVRSERFRDLVKAEPSLLYFRGRYSETMLRRERISREEVLAAIRSQGTADLTAVHAVVLETDGSFSVIAERDGPRADALEGVYDVDDGPLPAKGG